jgi:hypothetical protein
MRELRKQAAKEENNFHSYFLRYARSVLCLLEEQIGVEHV